MRSRPVEEELLLLEEVVHRRLARARVRRLEEQRELALDAALAALLRDVEQAHEVDDERRRERRESWQRKLIFICIGTPAKPTMSMLSQASFESPRGL